MTVLFENRRRANRARFTILAAIVWSLGWFYWANVLRSGGTRMGVVVIVGIVGILPLVALHFYGNVYVIRMIRDGERLDLTTLGLFGKRERQIAIPSIVEVAAPEAGVMTLRVKGQRTPYMHDLQAEYIDADAISALARAHPERAPDSHAG